VTTDRALNICSR